MRCWVLTESLSIILALLWLGVNVYLFIDTFYWYEEEESFLYTRVLLGSTLAWARASAVCLNFNCMLILLPISRNLISFIRGTNICCRGSWRRQLDKTLKFHKLVAYGIAINTAIHIVAHLCNLERYRASQSGEAGGLPAALSKLGDAPNETYLNPIRNAHSSTAAELLTTTAGVTGLLATLALILTMTSSTESMRQASYELFWCTHHVFILFFISLAVHGAGRMVRGQTPESLRLHNITFCRARYPEWQAATPCPVPQFSGKEPSAWKWVLGPVVLYTCERVIRFWRFQQEVFVTKVVSHPSRVLELQMKKRSFKMAPGQYILIQCPSISTLEWHPFTLTSAPQEDFFSVHIQAAGDWTAALCQAFGAGGHVPEAPRSLPRYWPKLQLHGEWRALPPASARRLCIELVLFSKAGDLVIGLCAHRLAVDGPFGASLMDVFHYPVSVCIAAGIGVTPFASLLKSVWYKCESETQPKLSKVYFYWICRDPSAFEWFADLLLSLETRMSEQGKAHCLSYHIFLTGWDENQAIYIALHWDENTDVITGLRQKTFYGRPNWNKEFQQIACNHPGEYRVLIFVFHKWRQRSGILTKLYSSNIGVFFCGPKALSKTLQSMCRLYSSADPRGVHFYYNRESF